MFASSLGAAKLVAKRAMRSPRWLSSSSSSPEALWLWLGEEGEAAPALASSWLLPVAPVTRPTVWTTEDAIKQVRAHYAEAEEQFVGGMGEEDPGVWWVACPGNDALEVQFHDLIAETMEASKAERHGVPFRLFTQGLVGDLPPQLADWGLESLQVALYAGTPDTYAEASGQSPSDFGQACGLVVAACEAGISVEAWAAPAHLAGARDLALSLGAQQVHVAPAPSS